MAVVVVDDDDTTSTVYLLGGDTYDGTISNENVAPGLLDQSWYNGYKNDVWKMSGTEWGVRGDSRLRTLYKQKIPTVRSALRWQVVTVGLLPPLRTTYDDWIICEEFFNIDNANYKAKRDAYCTSYHKSMWSPRRHHAALFFNGYLWVLGGRAREVMDLPRTRTVGGIVDPRIYDLNIQGQIFSTQREASVVKSDVWKSVDGSTWSLVTPGCKRNQRQLLAEGNTRENKLGRLADVCNDEVDCYGSETCNTQKTCECSMWSPREQHAVAAYGGVMYVMGGYASALFSQMSNCGAYACGDTDASSYRYYTTDLWQSTDGAKWKSITTTIFPNSSIPLGRGGHQMVVIPMKGVPYLYIFGGRGGNNKEGNITYFNDIWRSPIDGNLEKWELVVQFAPWSPRAGHTISLEPATSRNGNMRFVYLVGGSVNDDNNSTAFSDEVWVWRPDIDPPHVWRQDFTNEALFSTGDGSEFHYANYSPSVFFVTPDSNVSALKRFIMPSKVDSVTGKRLDLRPYITDQKLEMLTKANVLTVRQLAEADKYTILKLRGYDYPQVQPADRLSFGDICDVRALAIAVVKKCSVNSESINLFDGEKNMPWNILPEFGGDAPAVPMAAWHNRPRGYPELAVGDDDPTAHTENWDGCKFDPIIEGLKGPNVDGLGTVSQVKEIRTPEAELTNIFCKQSPGQRAFHAAAFFEERLYVFGGKQSEAAFMADAWYRDSRLPIARFQVKPPDHSSFPTFQFSSDEPGVTFEYRIWDPYYYKEIRPWTAVVSKTDIGWLSWRMSGPSNGLYTIFVRSVDPAGNRDERYVLNRNVYTWYYVSPTPWDIILEVISSILFLCVIGYFEYRRRVKKAAMERYAMKRMRRKFKAMQRDIDGRSMDWRTLYLESKEGDGIEEKRRKGNKKQRDKKREQRDKEKLKREKEKERIKKKLKASKDIKQKAKKDKDVEKAKEFDKLEKSKTSKSKGSRSKGGDDDDAVDEEDETDASALLIDARGEKAKAKERMKTKMKDYEIENNLEEGDRKSGKKYKDYEQSVGFVSGDAQAATVSASNSTVLGEEGAKQRRANKRYKDYEVNEDQDKDSNDIDNGDKRDNKQKANKKDK